MLQQFISVLHKRTAKIVKPRFLRHTAYNTFKHKKRKYIFPCVNAFKSSARPVSKFLFMNKIVSLYLPLNKITDFNFQQNALGKSLHTSNTWFNRQTEEDEVPPVYYIQNPLAWFRKNMQIGRLRRTWDPEFTEEEFLKGAKQAVASITQAIEKDDFLTIEKLTTPQAAAILNVTSRLWQREVKRHIALRPEDVRLAVPIRIFLNRLYSTTDMICEIDTWFVGVKSIATDTFFIVELLARFNRDYARELSGWNVVIFQVRRFQIRGPKKN